MVRILVVGAGIVGAAIAYEATKAGAQVTLLDRGPVAELGASRWGFGGVSWASAVTPATIAYSRRGFERYVSMDAELGRSCSFRPGETLILVKDGAEQQRAEALVAGFTARGGRARLLSRLEAAALEPGLNLDGWRGAMGLGQGHLNLQQCARAWVERAAELGLEVREGVEVHGIAADGSTLETSAGPLSADFVFIVAGAWARPLLRAAGSDVPVMHSHAEFLYSGPVAPVLGHQVSWGALNRLQTESASVEATKREAWVADAESEIVPHSQELGFVQFADGHVRIGQISRLLPGYFESPQPESYRLLLDAARQIWPAVDSLPDLTLGRRQVAFTPDHLPIVGPLPGLPQAILVAPSNSPTVMAPAIGEAMAAYALRGDWDPLLDEWRLDRAALYSPPLRESQVVTL